MSLAVAKKTFSIKPDIALELDLYKNKSKFVNEALSFYIDYIKSFKKYKETFLEKKLNEALEWDFYNIDLSLKENKNEIIFKEHSTKLENNLLLAVKD